MEENEVKEEIRETAEKRQPEPAAAPEKKDSCRKNPWVIVIACALAGMLACSVGIWVTLASAFSFGPSMYGMSSYGSFGNGMNGGMNGGQGYDGFTFDDEDSSDMDWQSFFENYASQYEDNDSYYDDNDSSDVDWDSFFEKYESETQDNNSYYDDEDVYDDEDAYDDEDGLYDDADDESEYGSFDSDTWQKMQEFFEGMKELFNN